MTIYTVVILPAFIWFVYLYREPAFVFRMNNVSQWNMLSMPRRGVAVVAEKKEAFCPESSGQWFKILESCGWDWLSDTRYRITLMLYTSQKLKINCWQVKFCTKLIKNKFNQDNIIFVQVQYPFFFFVAVTFRSQLIFWVLAWSGWVA